MLLIVGTFRMPVEKLPQAWPIMEQMVSASRAEEGCVHYSYGPDLVEPGLVHVKEMWRDRASLDAHFASDTTQEWRRAWPMLNIEERALHLYEVGDPEEI